MFIFDMIRAGVDVSGFLTHQNLERQDYQIKVLKSMEKLANRKKVILSTTICNFIQVYEKIVTIDFIESDKIYPLNQNYFDSDMICELRSMVVTSGFSMDFNQLIYTYLVGELKGRRYLDGDSNRMDMSLERNDDVEKSRNKRAVVSVDVFFLRSERLSVLLAHLNLHFRRCIDKTETIVDKYGQDSSKYSMDDKQCIRNCLYLADAVKLVIDTPLIDDTGELTEKSLEAIRQGNECLILLMS